MEIFEKIGFTVWNLSFESSPLINGTRKICSDFCIQRKKSSCQWQSCWYLACLWSIYINHQYIFCTLIINFSLFVEMSLPNITLLYRSSRQASYFAKISVFFFSRSDFFIKISRTHQIFQENQKYYKNTLEHIKISRRAFSKFCKNTYDCLVDAFNYSMYIYIYTGYPIKKFDILVFSFFNRPFW